MKKLLILSFRKIGDLVSLSIPLANYKQGNPFTEITLCTFSEYNEAANMLASVDKTIFIDRESLGLLSQNKIFSKSFLLNEFEHQFQEIYSTKWDMVFNATNDTLSTLITSGLICTEVRGLSYSSDMSTKSYPLSSFVKNEINTACAYTPVHQLDLDNFSLNLSFLQPFSGRTLNFDAHMEKVAEEEISKIREKNGLQILAINFQAGLKGKEIPHETVFNLIQILIEEKRFFPLVLLDPNRTDTPVFIKNLTERFGHSCAAVEVGLNGIPSILKRTDCLITVDSLIKHMADALNTKTVEVSLGTSPFLRQGTIKPGNIILSPIDENRPLLPPGSERNLKEYYQNVNTNLSENDVLFALDLVEGRSPEKISRKISPNITFYICKNLGPGVTYLPVWGDLVADKEILRISAGIFARENWFQYKNYPYWQELSSYFEINEISQFIQNERKEISLALKAILNCLRTLKDNQQSRHGRQNFIKSLDAILSWDRQSCLTWMAIRSFDSEINSLPPKSQSETIFSIEKMLFQMKAQLQLLGTHLDTLNIKTINKNAFEIGRTS